MQTNYQEILSIGLKAVQTASILAKQIQQEITLAALDKEDHSPVTVADFSSQAVISHILQEALGGFTLVGEEDSYSIQQPEQQKTLQAITQFVKRVFPNATPTGISSWIDYGNAEPADTFWTVDPIDGTKGFLRGDQYVVALAYLEEGAVKVGILGCPNLDSDARPDQTGCGALVYAIRGQGTWISPMNDISTKTRLQVSTLQKNAKIRLLRSFESAHTNSDKTAQFLTVLGTSEPAIPMDSQAKYALLAAGHGELLLRFLSPKRLEYKEKIWDQAAGSIILEEAGGKITDLLGAPLDFTRGRMLLGNTGVLATNGYFHEESLRALRTIENSTIIQHSFGSDSEI